MAKKLRKPRGLSKAQARRLDAGLTKLLPAQDAAALRSFLEGTLGLGPNTGLPLPAKRAAEKLTSRSLYTPEMMVDPSRLFASGLFSQFNPSILVTRQGLALFDEMMLDEQVKMALTFKTLAVLAPGYLVRSPGDEEDDWEVTQFVRDSFTNFQGGFISQVKKIMRALRYGFSITEKIYAKPNEAPAWAEGKVTLKKLNEVKPHYIDFDMNAYGELLAIIQRWTPGTATSIPEKVFSPEKFVHYAHDREHENPYGRSDLEAAYRPWWAKDNAYKWLTVALERYGMPPVFLLYQPDDYQPNQVEALKRIMKNLQNATNGILPRPEPESLEFWTQQIGSGSKDIFLGALGRFDTDIAKAVLMPTHIGATSETKDQGSGGSMARSNVHFKMFMFVVSELQREVAQVINDQVIKQLCDLNFPNLKSYPEIVFNDVDDEVETKIFELWNNLVTGKVVGRIEDDETHIRAALGMPKNDEVKLEPLPGDAKLEMEERMIKEGARFGKDGKADKGGKGPFGKDDEEPKGKKPVKVPFEELSAQMRTFADENNGIWLRLENGHAICVDRDRYEFAWDESKHPRHPGGTSEGGEFAPASGPHGGRLVSSVSAIDDDEWSWEVSERVPMPKFRSPYSPEALDWLSKLGTNRSGGSADGKENWGEVVHHGGVERSRDEAQAAAAKAFKKTRKFSEYASKHQDNEHADGTWRTIRGRRVFLRHGEGVGKALRRQDKVNKAFQDILAENVLEDRREYDVDMLKQMYGLNDEAAQQLHARIQRQFERPGKYEGRTSITLPFKLEGSRSPVVDIKYDFTKPSDVSKLRDRLIDTAPSALKDIIRVIDGSPQWLRDRSPAVKDLRESAKRLLHIDDQKEFAEEGGVWRTVRGRRIFIREGQSVEDAIAQADGKSSRKIDVNRGDDGKFHWKAGDKSGKADTERDAIQAARDAMNFAYDPSQPRKGKGDPAGGQWTTATDAQAAEAVKKIPGKGRLVNIDDLFGKGKRADQKTIDRLADEVEVVSPFGPLAKGKDIWKDAEVKIADLKFVEKTIFRGNLQRMLQERADVARLSKGEPTYAIDTGKGLVLMDGHHRAAAAHLLGEKTMSLRVVDGKKFSKLVQEMM